MSGFVDTLINLFVFAFIGLLIWLYFKEGPSEGQRQDDVSGDSRPHQE